MLRWRAPQGLRVETALGAEGDIPPYYDSMIAKIVSHGATREEVLETLGMAIYMGAGPSVMYASHALGAFTQFEAAKAPSPANG